MVQRPRDSIIIMDNSNTKDKRLLSRKETQEVLLSMLDAFLAYCGKYNLRYYLVGGTLLGAIRHKGFIPWDDDIDVGMPRFDYERLLELVKTDPIGEEFKVLSGSDGTLGNPFAEMIHMGTWLDKNTAKYLDGDSLVTNLFLDILPMDGWPEDEAEAVRYFKWMKKRRKMIVWSRATIGEGTTKVRALLKLPALIICHMIGYRRIVRKMEEKAKRLDYDNSKYVGVSTYGLYGVGERYLRTEALDIKEIEFEGRKCNAPGCIHTYLSGIYGDDYMELPPEDKRKTHEMKVWINK